MTSLSETQAVVHVAPDLFGLRGRRAFLLAGRDCETGRLVFPMPEGGERQSFEPIELPRNGKLWTWTIQRFCPKPPYDGDAIGESFKAFAVGYVEFSGLIIVQGRLHLDDLSELQIGMTMKTIAYPYRTRKDGTVVLTYAFEPVR